MRRLALIVAAVLVTMIVRECVITREEAKYEVVSTDKNCEIRDYAPHVVAETVVDGTLEDAGNRAFNRLFAYISGKNRSRDKLAMTAPVSQEPAPEKIEMTSVVGQQRVKGGWTVAFTMPASYTMETLPVPDDPDVKLRLVPPCRMAAVGYSGVWSEKRYRRYMGGAGIVD